MTPILTSDNKASADWLWFFTLLYGYGMRPTR